MLYNCSEKAITIPLLDEPSVSVTTLYITKSCCGEPEPIIYCNPENQTNLLNISFTIDNLSNICEEPGCICYAEMTWDELININLTDVISFTGTKETYISSILTTTDTLDITYFNTVHNIYTVAYQADRNYIYNLSFELTNGITINYTLQYNTNVDIFSDNICSIIDFDNTIEFEYNCVNELTIDSNIHFPIELIDGFYFASWGEYEGCFLVECEETLACKIKNYIKETFNSTCYHCNKEKDLENTMNLLFYYRAFISDCLDCCEKCKIYNKILDIINGCKDC